MKRLVIIGAGGHGKVAADIAELMGYDPIVFLDDRYPARLTNGSWPIVGQTDQIVPEDHEKTDFFVAVGSGSRRRVLTDALNGRLAATLIHPSAQISRHAKLGPGTVAVAGSIVNAAAAVEQGVILNTGCSVDHDCTIGDYSHIAPGARLAGTVTVGARSHVGLGAVVREGIRIGDDVIVGAGSVVVRDVGDGQTVFGNPARTR